MNLLPPLSSSALFLSNFWFSCLANTKKKCTVSTFCCLFPVASLYHFKVRRSLIFDFQYRWTPVIQVHLFASIIQRQLTSETSVAAAPTNAAINRWKVIWNCKKMQKEELSLATEKKNMLCYIS